MVQINSQTVFNIEKLVKKFDGNTVLNVEGLEIQTGYIYALIGPNGAGKSTLLRQLNFLDEPEESNYKFLGVPYKELKKQKLAFQRKMTMVFQKPSLFNGSVFDNVAYGLKIRGYQREQIKVRVMHALEMVGLTDKVSQRAVTLSGGEAQRVALARAIVFRPEVLLLDEPTASLDPQNGLEVEKLIRKINEEMGTTIIIVTHNMFQAKRLAHQVVFLMGGKIIEQGGVEELFNNPKENHTKAFISGEIVF